MFWHPCWPTGEPVLRGDYGLARDWRMSEPLPVTIVDFDLADPDAPLFLTSEDEALSHGDLLELLERADTRQAER